MFTSDEARLEVYRETVRLHLEAANSSLVRRQEVEARRCKADCEAMQRVLGLAQTEITQIYAEVGKTHNLSTSVVPQHDFGTGVAYWERH